VVIVPKEAAPGNPWSWRGCYWDHQPQTEVELLHRGFHIAFVAPIRAAGKAVGRLVRLLDGATWALEKTGFHWMSKGGVNEYNWAASHPDKVACIYADNPPFTLRITRASKNWQE